MTTDMTAERALDDLSELSRAVSLENGGASLTEVVNALLLCARAHAGPHASASLFLADEGSERLELAVPEGTGEIATHVLATPIANCTSPCGRAALGGETVIVEDVSRDPRCAGHFQVAKQLAIHSCWSFPVRGKGDQVLGALALCFHSPQAAQPRLLWLMDFLARFAGLTVQRHRDSEERARAEAQLRDSESRYRSLTKTLTSIVWTCDPQARFTAPQPSWQQYTGQSWEQQQGFGWFQAIHPDDRDSVMADLMRGLENKAYFRADGRLWHEDTQTYRYCEARGMPVLGENDNVIEWVGTCVDVDDYKRAEEALKTADQRKDEFMAVLAHEFRNLLAPVRNAVHILKASDSGNERHSSMGTIIERQVDQIARLLEDLLDVSRITRQQVVLQKVRVALDSIVEASLETSRPVLQQHGHHFELNSLAGLLWVEADPTRLAQVFANLLNNAAKYTDNGGRVSLTVRSEGDYAVVAVKDSGIGIEPDMLPRLFQMFSRTTSAIRRSGDGLGIGLALVRGLVDAHGGTVQAYSQGAGHGSEFVVRIPLAR